MIVTLNEMKTDFERYLEMAGGEEIVVTKDGMQIASITPSLDSPDAREANIRSLCGVLPVTATIEDAHEERIAKYENRL